MGNSIQHTQFVKSLHRALLLTNPSSSRITPAKRKQFSPAIIKSHATFTTRGGYGLYELNDPGRWPCLVFSGDLDEVRSRVGSHDSALFPYDPFCPLHKLARRGTYFRTVYATK